MKGIQCAFEGKITRAAELKTARASGKQFITFTVMTEGERAQRIDVLAWRDSDADLVPHLTEGVEIYVEGRIELRTWDNPHGGHFAGLSVSASEIKPLALIGHRKPKTTRTVKGKAKADSQAPLAFADGTDSRQGDAIPF